MKKLTQNFYVAWADCDAAGQVFYPNYYRWFDQATEKLMRANELTFSELDRQFGIQGMPLLETNAKYENICKHGVKVMMESWVEAWEGKTFIVNHKVTHEDGRIALTGFEKRIFVIAAPERQAGIRAVAPPDEVKSILGGKQRDSSSKLSF